MVRFKESGSAVTAFAMARQVSCARWADIREASVVALVLFDESQLESRDEDWDDEARALIPRPSPGPIRAILSSLLLLGGSVQTSEGVDDEADYLLQARPEWKRVCAGWPSNSRPSNSTLPLRLATSPISARRVVVLPATLRPINVTISPAFTLNVTFCTTWMRSYPRQETRLRAAR